MQDLFEEHSSDNEAGVSEQLQPLAARMRPTSISEYAGQSHLFEKGKPLFEAIEKGKLHSMLFWGPPGTGKTTLAKMIAAQADCHFIAISAVLGSVKDIRAGS